MKTEFILTLKINIMYNVMLLKCYLNIIEMLLKYIIEKG